MKFARKIAAIMIARIIECVSESVLWYAHRGWFEKQNKLLPVKIVWANLNVHVILNSRIQSSAIRNVL